MLQTCGSFSLNTRKSTMHDPGYLRWYVQIISTTHVATCNVHSPTRAAWAGETSSFCKFAPMCEGCVEMKRFDLCKLSQTCLSLFLFSLQASSLLLFTPLLCFFLRLFSLRRCVNVTSPPTPTRTLPSQGQRVVRPSSAVVMLTAPFPVLLLLPFASPSEPSAPSHLP